MLELGLRRKNPPKSDGREFAVLSMKLDYVRRPFPLQCYG